MLLITIVIDSLAGGIDVIVARLTTVATIDTSGGTHVASISKFGFDLKTLLTNTIQEQCAGPEGLEPSTNCFAGSNSVQAELWAPHRQFSAP